MDNKIQVWLYDVLNSNEEIESFVSTRKDFFEYKNDLKTKRAVERNIEIIGEAINRIIKQDSSISIENARNIIGTRNKIIHSYDNISDELIWSIVINHLPLLKEEVSKIVSEGYNA